MCQVTASDSQQVADPCTDTNTQTEGEELMEEKADCENDQSEAPPALLPPEQLPFPIPPPLPPPSPVLAPTLSAVPSPPPSTVAPPLLSGECNPATLLDGVDVDLLQDLVGTGWNHHFLSYQDYLQWPKYSEHWKEKREGKKDDKDAFSPPASPKDWTDAGYDAHRKFCERVRKEGKLLLLLDLDHTLVHCTNSSQKGGDQPYFRVDDEVWWYHLRPGSIDFLNKVSAKFEIFIYTFANRAYGAILQDVLLKEGAPALSGLITRDDCHDKVNKSIREVFPDGDMTVVVDDNKGWVWEDLKAVVRAPPYYYFGKKSKRSPNDDHLYHMADFLMHVHSLYYTSRTPTTTDTILRTLRASVHILNPMHDDTHYYPDLPPPTEEDQRARKRKTKQKQAAKENKSCAPATAPSHHGPPLLQHAPLPTANHVLLLEAPDPDLV